MGFQWFSYDLLVKLSAVFSTAEASNVEEAEMRLVLEMSLMSVEAGESMGKMVIEGIRMGPLNR